VVAANAKATETNRNFRNMVQMYLIYLICTSLLKHNQHLESLLSHVYL
jgi:hypothetical protein